MKKNLKFVVAMAGALVMMTALQVQAQEETYPNKVKTHIGELTFDHGIPTEETSKKLYL